MVRWDLDHLHKPKDSDKLIKEVKKGVEKFKKHRTKLKNLKPKEFMALIKELEKLQQKFGINPAGEGGEFESFVLDAPMFSEPIDIIDSRHTYHNYAGRLEIRDAQ